jgi:hypothetical protein
MRPLVILVLLGFWLFMAYRAYGRGDVSLAVVLLVVGFVLTAYRMRLGRGRAR